MSQPIESTPRSPTSTQAALLTKRPLITATCLRNNDVRMLRYQRAQEGAHQHHDDSEGMGMGAPSIPSRRGRTHWEDKVANNQWRSWMMVDDGG